MEEPFRDKFEGHHLGDDTLWALDTIIKIIEIRGSGEQVWEVGVEEICDSYLLYL